MKFENQELLNEVIMKTVKEPVNVTPIVLMPQYPASDGAVKDLVHGKWVSKLNKDTTTEDMGKQLVVEFVSFYLWFVTNHSWEVEADGGSLDMAAIDLVPSLREYYENLDLAIGEKVKVEEALMTLAELAVKGKFDILALANVNTNKIKVIGKQTEVLAEHEGYITDSIYKVVL